MLEGSKQADVIELLEVLLSNGLLLQQEVNRNRPTVAVAPQLADSKQRLALISAVQIPPPLMAKFIAKILKCGSAASPNTQDRTSAQATNANTVTSEPKRPPTMVADTATTSPRDSARDTSPVTPRDTVRVTERASERAFVADNALDPKKDAPPSPHLRAADEVQPALANVVDKQASSNDVVEDWTWSVKLLSSGHAWGEVMSIRRMTDIELAGSLIAALQHGERVDRAWLAPADAAGERTVGQQRVNRELQRRSAAGVR